jgi:hypothetical protein
MQERNGSTRDQLADGKSAPNPERRRTASSSRRENARRMTLLG